MEAIFLAKGNERISDVFHIDIVAEFCPELLPIKVFSKDDVISDREKFKDVKYIFSTWYMPTFSMEEVLECFPALDAIFYAAGSVKYFAEPFFQAGVRVFSAGRANAIPVAEYVVAQILLANKGYFQAQREYRKPLYRIAYKRAHQYINAKTGNNGAMIGLIGLGMVATKVVDLLKPYNLRVCAHDPYVDTNRMAQLGVEKVELAELFEHCDVISNHLPDTVDTKGMINYNLFSKMKSGATFINTGRGAQVVENDLVRALRGKPMSCALLDVTGHEPMWPWSRLYRCRNIFVTPHIAGSSNQEEQRLAEFIFKAYINFQAGQPSMCEVTNDMLSNMA